MTIAFLTLLLWTLLGPADPIGAELQNLGLHGTEAEAKSNWDPNG